MRTSCTSGVRRGCSVRGGKGVIIGPNQSITAQLLPNAGAAEYQAELRRELVDTGSVDIVAAPGYTTLGTRVFKYGVFKFGIELRGCKVRPKACLDWAMKGGGLGLPKHFFDDNQFWPGLQDRAAYLAGFKSEGGSSFGTLGEAVEAQERAIAKRAISGLADSLATPSVPPRGG